MRKERVEPLRTPWARGITPLTFCRDPRVGAARRPGLARSWERGEVTSLSNQVRQAPIWAAKSQP